MIVAFSIPGKPFAKQRPRATRQGRVYTPKETVSFERTVAQIALQHFPKPIEGPIHLKIGCFFETPASWSQKKRAAKSCTPHTQRPDIDNCIKAISDALNRIAWADDGQVATVTASKWWSDSARTEVIVETIGGLFG